MRGLTAEQLSSLKELTNEKLLILMRRYADREHLIDLQNANGIAHKDVSDPDVKALKDSVIAIRAEINKRVGGVSDRALVDDFLTDSKEIAQQIGFSRGALGIPQLSKTANEVKTMQESLVTKFKAIEGKMR